MSLDRAKLIIHALRPATLLTGAAPVFLGASVGFSFNPHDSSRPQLMIFFVSVMAVIVMQAAANLVNDAKDAENGIDSSERKGPIRVVQSGLLDLKTVKTAYQFCFALSIALSLVVAYYGGIYVLIAAIISAVFAYAYTGGPFPLAYYAMGEITAFVFFGLVAVAFSAFLQANNWNTDYWYWGIGPGLISASIMAINNYRDIDTDISAGKHTLATIANRSLAMYLPLIFSLLALIVPFFLKPDLRGHIAVIVSLLLAFLILKIYPLLKSGNSESLNEALRFTALLNLFYCVAFALMNLYF